MAERRIEELGPTGQRVGTRVREIRTARGLTLDQLAARMTEVGQPMHATVVARVENGNRRVDVDTLVALALALDSTVAELLLPTTATATRRVRLTPAFELSERQAWRWLTGDEVLSLMLGPVKIGGRHGTPKQLDPDVIDARLRAAAPHRRDEGADATIAEIEAIPARDRRRIAELAERYGRATFGMVAVTELAERRDNR